MLLCSYCRKECKSTNSLRNHERLCKSNPNRDLKHIENAHKNRLKAIAKTETCQYCLGKFSKSNIKRHEESCNENPSNQKECLNCGKMFAGKATTCGYACSNSYYRHSRKGGTQYKTDDYLAENGKYVQLCFRHHKKECIVCGEKRIVAAHHLNGDKTDNRPENLVPLCPTHHTYWHSRYRKIIEQKVNDYIRDWVSG